LYCYSSAMPLQPVDLAVDSHPLNIFQYLIFYSSIVDGQLWCPDCRDVKSLIEDTFSTDNSPTAGIIYVGNRAEWKEPSNVFRSQPWNITSVPTILKITGGEVVNRLEYAIPESLKNFVSSVC